MITKAVDLTNIYGNGVIASKRVDMTIRSGLLGLLGPAGDMTVNVWCGPRPQGFELVYPELEDVHFTAMRGISTTACMILSLLHHQALDRQYPVVCTRGSLRS